MPNCRTGKKQLEECDIHIGCSLLKKGGGKKSQGQITFHTVHLQNTNAILGKIRKSSVNIRARSEKNQRM